MDLIKLLSELRSEREHIARAILVLENLARGGKRRGRPPKWMAQPKPEEAPREAPKRRRAKRETSCSLPGIAGSDLPDAKC